MTTDGPFDNQEDPAFEAYAAHREALMLRLSEFADERDLDEGLLAAMLLEAAISMSALGYALSVAKPSESGLKMNFDRFQRAFVELVRLSKKDARDHLARIMAALDQAEAMVAGEDKR
jgi:hypothetical protein